MYTLSTQSNTGVYKQLENKGESATTLCGSHRGHNGVHTPQLTRPQVRC